MTNDDLPFDSRHLRGTDSNSLLRMYDRAQDIVANSLRQLERARADKAIQRIAKELAKRQVPLAPARAGAAGDLG
jgi:hypothetical protein